MEWGGHVLPELHPPPSSQSRIFSPLLQVGIYFLLFFGPFFLLGWVFAYVFNLLAGSVLITLTSALIGNFLCLRIFFGVGFEGVGMPLNNTGLRNCVTGLILGFAAVALVLIPAFLTGHARETFENTAHVNWREQMFVPAMLLAGAAGEELLFRGFGFQVLLRSFGPVAAILPIGILFGLMHSNNPNASWLGIANTAGFGILFCYAFLRSHDIWFPFGLHFGWNLTLLLFGADISGIKMSVTSYQIVWSGSMLWSGGEYGPEASVLTSIALVLLAGAVWKTRVTRQYAYLVDDPRRQE
jgi:uncharacterized protein